MKKFIATLMMMAMIAVMLPLAANAQTRNSRNYRNRTNTTRINTTRTNATRTYQNQNQSFYDKHRNLINIGIGTAAGAILGGIIGGKKGALIGTAAGAGGSALYTYKINPKDGRRYRVYR